LLLPRLRGRVRVGAFRQREGEHRTAAWPAFLDHQAASMPLGQLATDVQAEPSAGNVAESGFIRPMELVKDACPFAVGNAHALIAYPDDRSLAVTRQRDQQVWLAEAIAQAVIDEIVQDSTKLLAARLHQNRISWATRGNLGA